MRSIYLLLIALALVSVSSQGKVNFGEFVEAHEAAEKKFVLLKSSSTELTKFAQNNKVFVIVTRGTKIELKTVCGSCTSTDGRTPQCPTVKCVGASRTAFNDAKAILFAQKNPAKFFWSQNSSVVNLKTTRGVLSFKKN